jgi:hypothetical protein
MFLPLFIILVSFCSESKTVQYRVESASIFSEGVYMCNASNAAGSAIAQTFLDIKGEEGQSLGVRKWKGQVCVSSGEVPQLHSRRSQSETQESYNLFLYVLEKAPTPTCSEITRVWFYIYPIPQKLPKNNF